MTPTAQARDAISFGPFSLIAGERLLTRDGAPVELGARALDVLITLVSRPNEVVSKKDLLDRVWPDVTVEESSLRFALAGLRKALGDGQDGARYITTLAGRGYCFVASLAQIAPELPASPSTGWSGGPRHCSRCSTSSSPPPRGRSRRRSGSPSFAIREARCRSR